jgi:hypothetical protein
MRSLHSPVILLDHVVQVCTRPDFRLWAQPSTLLELCHSRVCGGIAVERYPCGSTVSLNCSDQESFGRGNISMFAQSEIDREPLPIDCSIEISPPPSDSDVRFVNSPRGTAGSCVVRPPLLELRDGALSPISGVLSERQRLLARPSSRRGRGSSTCK